MKCLDINDIHKIETKLVEVCDKICLDNNINYTLVCGSVLGAVRHNGPIPWDTDVDMTIAYDDMNKFVEAMKNDMPSWCDIDLPDNSKTSAVSFPRIFVKGIDPMVIHLDVFTYVGLPENYDDQLRFSKKSDFLNKVLFYKKCNVLIEYYKSRNALFSFANKVRRALMKILLFPISNKKLFKMINNHYLQFNSKTSKFVMNPAGHYRMKNVIDRKFYDETVRMKYDYIEANIPKNFEDYLIHYYKDWEKLPSEKERKEGMEYKLIISDEADLSFLY